MNDERWRCVFFADLWVSECGCKCRTVWVKGTPHIWQCQNRIPSKYTKINEWNRGVRNCNVYISVAMFCLHADAISAGICDSFWSDFLLKRKNGGKKQLVLIRFYAHEENWREITAHFDPFLSSRTKRRIKLIWEMVRYEISPALKWMQERYSFWAERVVDIGHFLFDPFL